MRVREEALVRRKAICVLRKCWCCFSRSAAALVLLMSARHNGGCSEVAECQAEIGLGGYDAGCLQAVGVLCFCCEKSHVLRMCFCVHGGTVQLGSWLRVKTFVIFYMCDMRTALRVWCDMACERKRSLEFEIVFLSLAFWNQKFGSSEVIDITVFVASPSKSGMAQNSLK